MKAVLTSLAFALSLFALCPNISSVTAASLENPKLDHAEISVSPLVQGIDGNLVIQTLVQVNGTC